jgi:hypothetical protein
VLGIVRERLFKDGGVVGERPLVASGIVAELLLLLLMVRSNARFGYWIKIRARQQANQPAR